MLVDQCALMHIILGHSQGVHLLEHVRLLERMRYSLFPLAIVRWNALTEAVVSLQDLESF